MLRSQEATCPWKSEQGKIARLELRQSAVGTVSSGSGDRIALSGFVCLQLWGVPVEGGGATRQRAPQSTQKPLQTGGSCLTWPSLPPVPLACDFFFSRYFCLGSISLSRSLWDLTLLFVQQIFIREPVLCSGNTV